MTSAQRGTPQSSLGSSDLEDARAFFQGNYNGRDYRLEATERPFAFRCSTVGDDDLRLRSIVMDGAMSGSFVLTDVYATAWLTAGTGTLTAGSDRVDFEPGQPLVIPRDRSCHFAGRNYRDSSMLFGAGFLDAQGEVLEGAAAGSLRFETQPLRMEHAATWAHTARSTAKVLNDPHSTVLMVAEAKQTAAAAMLECFPHQFAPAPEQVRSASRRIAAATEYIRAHADQPITIRDIATAAGLSTRGVQTAFTRDLGMPPLTYLRLVRLDRARDDLLAGPAGFDEVSTVARRWGFGHLGRFAGYYADRHGEAPSTTLRRASYTADELSEHAR